MITLLLTSITLLNPSNLDTWMAARGYSAPTDYSDPGINKIGYRKESSEAFLNSETWDVPQAPTFKTKNGSLDVTNESVFSAPGDTDFHPGLPSGLPLGSDVWRMKAQDGAVKIGFRTPWMKASVLVVPCKGVPTDPELMAEGISRHLLGEVEGQRLAVAYRKRLGDSTLPVWTTAEAVALADLDAWARLRGWAERLDDDRAVATLTKGTGTLTIPLGAMKVKLDDRWKDLPSCVVLKDDKWYVPLDALEAATTP